MFKKTLMLTALILLPLTAKAVPAPVGIPKITINTAIQRFSVPYCKQGLPALASAVQKCYQDTNDTSVMIDMCILGDIAIGKLLIQDHKADLSLLDKKPSELFADTSIPVDGIQAYMNFGSLLKRLQMLVEVPRFDVFQSDQILPYLTQGADPVYQGIIDQCKKLSSK